MSLNLDVYNLLRFKMKNVLFFLCVFTIHISSQLYGQKKMNMKSLKQAITKELSSQKGDFGVVFYDLQSKKHINIHADELFHAASTMKLPVMIEVFRQAHEGKFRLTDSLVVINQFKSIVDSSLYQLDSSDDSYSPLYHEIGRKVSIYDLTYLMIIHSSNLATNLVIDLVGAENVMSTIHKMGVKKMKVLRGVEDQKAYDLGMNNVTTASDLSLLLRDIALNRILSKTDCEAMIKILLDQKHNKIIPALLPPDVKVAHKTGNITGVLHDAGIVFLPDGRKYILVLLSKNLLDEGASTQAMAKVSRMIYDYEIR